MNEPIKVTVAARCELGMRKRNEDSVAFGETPYGHFALVSDGAGGHAGGDRASRLAAHVTSDWLQQPELPDGAAMSAILKAADESLKAEQPGLRGTSRMQATLVVLAIDAHVPCALWGHVGDSRLYLLRQGCVQTVTRDDSVVQHMVDAGWIDAAQARRHPNRNQLLAALGAEEDIEPHVSADALSLRDGDAFLLCSDGWWESMEPADIESYLDHAGTVDEWLDAMSQHVAAQAKPDQDNFSAVAVWIGDPTLVTRIAPT